MRKIICGIALLAAAVFVAQPAAALTTASGTSVSQTGEVKDVYAVGGTTVDLQGSYTNDVYTAGNSVTVSGPVSGDLNIGASTVTVTADVAGGVRIAGGTVTIDSKVGRNVVLLGGTLTIGTDADIAGEVIIAGGSVVINGHVAGAVNAWAGTATINGTVDGPVSLHLNGDDDSDAPALHLQQNAVLKGDLTYWATKDATIDTGATVSGTTKRHEAATVTTKDIKTTIQQFLAIGRLWSLFSALVVGVLLALLFPQTLRNVAATMLKRSGASIGWGVLLAFALPFAFFILMVTVIGIPLGFLCLGVYVAVFYLAQVFLGFLVGDLLMRWLGKRRDPLDGSAAPRQIAPVWPTLIGIVVMSAVLDFLFGYLGGFVAALSFLFSTIHLFLVLWTFGAVIIVLAGYVREHELK